MLSMKPYAPYVTYVIAYEDKLYANPIGKSLQSVLSIFSLYLCVKKKIRNADEKMNFTIESRLIDVKAKDVGANFIKINDKGHITLCTSGIPEGFNNDSFVKRLE